jgi:hypothetical protein
MNGAYGLGAVNLEMHPIGSKTIQFQVFATPSLGISSSHRTKAMPIQRGECCLLREIGGSGGR